ncbi:hypothetical protein KSP40_PGU011522 [Platanthera guangdongensis]|uniref:MADS-box domain-containing protein n=1 Tax=Platanthera guangdongensis TaxID=2320717 RepID=A0ABR2LN79_9ASPA
MGRARLEIKYREDRRARIATYWSRMTGVKKKAALAARAFFSVPAAGIKNPGKDTKHDARS